MPFAAEDPTCSKAAFAQLMNVTKGRVSQWLDARQIHGEAVVGEGRKARIHIERARAQLRNKLDISQSLINGAKSRRALNAPVTPAPEIPPPKTMRLLQDLPGQVAWAVIAHGCPAWVAFALEQSTRQDIVGIGALTGVYVDATGIAPTDWRALFDETDVDEPIDPVAWQAEQERYEAERDTRLAAVEREAR